jgi:hypothetical protein
MARPVARDVLRSLAEQYGVCVNPVVLRRTDTTTGETTFVEVPCGATLAAKCGPCAQRSRRDRMQQIRDGWHLEAEPEPVPDPPTAEQEALVAWRADLEFARADAERQSDWPGVDRIDGEILKVDDALSEVGLRGSLGPAERTRTPRRVRSTKRRQDAPDLPRLPVENRTVGRTYVGSDGVVHRPSMLVTLTLGSYGPVHRVARPGRPCECGQRHGEHSPALGTPVDPDGYDYRSAALDAIHFAGVLDRFWINVRRAVGWKVQYAGAVELQKRLAPHAHFAVRGTIARKLWTRIAAATYFQVWWPRHDEPVYSVDVPPVWDEQTGGYVDPTSRQALPTWDDALDAIEADPDAEPAYVARLGTLDARGIEGGTKDAERAVRYVTKYVTKDLAEQAAPDSDAQRAHFDRLAAELSVLPCSPSCANWLLYGVQPKGAKNNLVPGRCKGKVHQRRTLGFTGRRVLISRAWSPKTLKDIRDDRRDWVRALLAEHGEAGDADELTDPTADPGRYEYRIARPDEPDVPAPEHRLMAAIAARTRWRAALDQAQQRQAAVSTTTPAAA